MKSARTYLGWARSVLSPRDRLLPGLGARLGARPRVLSSILLFARRLPGRRLRDAARKHVSRPLLARLPLELEVPVDEGFRMRVDTSEAIGRVLATTGTWEPHVTAAFRTLLSPGDVCIDAGANIGYHTLLASRLVGPRGHVYSLEPAPKTYRDLVANVELNECRNVTALQVAAGAADGEVMLDDRPRGQSLHSSVFAGEHAAGLRVPVRSLATILEPAEMERLRLIKVDVEGHELEVLRGLEPILEAGGRPAVVLELHPFRAQEALPLLQGIRDRYRVKAYDLFDQDAEGHSVPWLGRPIELEAPFQLGYEPHLLLVF